VAKASQRGRGSPLGGCARVLVRKEGRKKVVVVPKGLVGLVLRRPRERASHARPERTNERTSASSTRRQSAPRSPTTGSRRTRRRRPTVAGKPGSSDFNVSSGEPVYDISVHTYMYVYGIGARLSSFDGPLSNQSLSSSPRSSSPTPPPCLSISQKNEGEEEEEESADFVLGDTSRVVALLPLVFFEIS